MKLDSVTRVMTSGVWAVILVWISFCLEQGQASRRTSYWLCPEVRCPAVRNGCQNTEYFVFAYSFTRHGRRVNVRCESCPYCTDTPWETARRRRDVQPASRGLYQLLASSNQLCQTFECPPITEHCNDAKNTKVILRDAPCGTCPACYDNVYHKNDVI